MTLAQLFGIQKRYPGVDQLHLIAGNTGENFDGIVHEQQYPALVHLARIPELQVLEEQSAGLLVGACVTISTLKGHAEKHQSSQQFYRVLFEQLEYNASRQVQNQATLGGHVLNHSRKHTSDILPILYVCNTKLRFIHLLEQKAVEVRIEDLHTTELKHLLLVSVYIPFVNNEEYLQSYKQAHRRKHDTGIVTCAFRLNLDGSGKRIQSLNMAFGGLSDGLVFVPEKTISYINNNPVEWTLNDVMNRIKKQLLAEVDVHQFSNEGQYEYR